MRSYGQCCALAKALDVMGDRWVLLIVRELLIRDGCRYTDLRNGLPGIATNLLVERLNQMEQAGLITRESAPPPVATTLYRLTSRGRDLEEVIAALGRWGAPLLGSSNADDVSRDHWIALPLRLYVRDRFPDRPAVRIRLRAGEEVVTLETVGDGSVLVQAGEIPNPSLRIEGPPRQILALLTGKTGAAENGLKIEGDTTVLGRFCG